MRIDGPSISICICTYKRAAGIVECLGSVAGVQVPRGIEVEGIVVDNDASATARATVLATAIGYPFRLRYFCEPQSGISHARNRCVEEANGEWVAFIDDDESVEPDWLLALWSVAAMGDVDAVFGPVIAEFERVAPDWLLASGAHRRNRFATGTSMPWGDCRTGNVLFRRHLFVEHSGFDARFAASGGEDCDFFGRCLAGGATLVWCDEAVVRERVPPARMTRAWILKRAFNGGRSFARLRAVRGGVHNYAVDAVWGLFSVLIYAFPALAVRAAGHVRALAYERKVAGGLGKLMAAFGSAKGEYGDARVTGQTR